MIITVFKVGRNVVITRQNIPVKRSKSPKIATPESSLDSSEGRNRRIRHRLSGADIFLLSVFGCVDSGV